MSKYIYVMFQIHQLNGILVYVIFIYMPPKWEIKSKYVDYHLVYRSAFITTVIFQNHQDALLLQQMEVAHHQALQQQQHAMVNAGMMPNMHPGQFHHSIPGAPTGLELDYYALLQAQGQAQLNASSHSRKSLF